MNEKFDAFAQEGYVLVRDAIDPDHILDLHRHLRPLFRARPNETLEHATVAAEKKAHLYVYEAGLTVGSTLSAYSLLHSLKLEEKAEALLGPGYFHVTPLHVSLQIPRETKYDYEWHVESDFYPWAPEILNLWFPVMASTVKDKTGTIELIPGSHKKAKRGSDKSRPGGYLQIVSHLDRGEEERAVQIEADPGDLLLFHKHMVHRSCPNLSNVPRATGIVRVIDQGKMEKTRVLYKALSYVS